MEYFLYAVTEAHKCVMELKQMEARVNILHDTTELIQLEIAGMNNHG